MQKGKYSRRANEKRSYWVQGKIFKYSKYKAYHDGLVTCRVNPRNTSRECARCGALVARYDAGSTPEGYTPGVLLLRHEGQRRPQREQRDRQAPACPLSTDAFSGKASRSSSNGEARESGRRRSFPSSRRQWKALSRPCPAWNRERARH